MRENHAMDTLSQTSPHTVRLARDGTAVALDWNDGSARVSAATLRGCCRCAWCTLARRRGEPVGEAEAITQFELMGGLAVHIVFSDGHRTGVFPWAYLRTLATDEAAPATKASA